MCGICGIYSFSSQPVELDCIRRMNSAIRHRGPDDEGFLLAATDQRKFRAYSAQDTISPLKEKLPYLAEESVAFRPNLLLGHRRLSIIDLSEKGHQPMSREGNWIVYNGEIYNYIELRKELVALGHRFNSESDTEVILAAYQQWGLDCLKFFNGMWAFALWDDVNRRLVCARDRFGIKPLYFSVKNGIFIFASEIKSILASGLVSHTANDQAVSHFLLFGTVDHSKDTFFGGIDRLKPGETLIIGENGQLLTDRWWKLGKREYNKDLLEEFRSTFDDSVRIRLRSDVPVGSCLSGGLDSSYVVAQMKTHCDSVNTFSAIYGHGMRGDESIYIDALTQHTGAVKHTIVPTGDALRNEILKLVYHQEEPFGSTSIFAQWKVMELARDVGTIVLLDGQGADELLSGYHPYIGQYYAILMKRLRWIKLIKELANYLSIHGLSKIIGYMGYHLLPPLMQNMVRTRISLLDKPYTKAYASTYPRESFTDFNEFLRYALETSLPQLLRYEDKNSMAFSRETRLPFLDYRLAELIYSIPVGEKIDGGITKKIMRKAMQGLVPDMIRNRYDKVGFGTPQDVWLRGELRPFIEEVFHSERFESRPYWNGDTVRETYERFSNGIGSSDPVWRVLSVELWLQAYADNSLH